MKRTITLGIVLLLIVGSIWYLESRKADVPALPEGASTVLVVPTSSDVDVQAAIDAKEKQYSL
ncbi:MAG: hypothetical protein AABY01_01650, partial [Nanoarchaeota archaeon]